MIHYGDITKIHGDQVPAVHVITGGSPCQDLSVAGKREGLKKKCHNYITCGFETDANSELERCPWCGSYLDLTRSGLFMEQIRIIKEMRENDRRNYAGADNADRLIRPRYMVWENVAGAFSSNSGEDFRVVLEETAKVADKDAVIPGLEGGKWSPCGCILGNGWSIAWRLHDAQYYGVPQRRKRICLLADFNGDTAGRILFELQRKTAESDSEQTVLDIGKEPEPEIQSVSEGVPGDTEACREEGQGIAEDIERCANEAGGIYDVPDSNHGGIAVVAYGIGSYDSNAMKSDNPHSGIYEADTSRTLDLNGGNPGCNQGGMAVVQGADVYNGSLTGEVAATLTEACGGTNTSGAKVVCVENHPNDSRVKISEDGMVQTLSSRMGTGGGNVSMVMEQSNWDGSQVSPTLTANNANGSQRMPDKDNFNAVLSIATKQISQNIGEDVGMTLCGNDYKEPQCVAYGLDRAAYNQGENAKFSFSVDEEKVGTCVAKGPNAVCKAVDCRNATENEMNGSLQAKASNNLNSNNVCRVNSVVRRLTPMECERLQGFKDGWTDIGDWVDSKGKMHKGESDAPRYKALGNSIALPFWQWMAERMMPYLGDKPTMASLFSGIGGFELVFSRAGCKPVWASEVEEFAIAVTKKRFPEE